MDPVLDPPAPYREWTCDRPLQSYVACGWSTEPTSTSLSASDEPVLPDGCMDIIWDGRRLFVAGPDTAPYSPATVQTATVGIRLQPGGGPLFLGVPARELRDRRVDLDCLWSDAGRIEEQLAATERPRDGAALLQEVLVRRAASLSGPDPVVVAATKRWRHRGGTSDITTLASQAGISERQLHRRFVSAVGYGPRLLHRVLRFQRFLADCGTSVLGLAELASQAGYADQAHLTREAKRLSGRTPVELRAARTGVRNVQDQVSTAQYNSDMDHSSLDGR